MTLQQLNKKAQSFDVTKALDKIMLANNNVFVEANREMLYSGKDAKGESIGGGQYAKYTIEYKLEKGQPVDRITLKDSGDYYAGKKLEIIGDEYTITSTDYKNEKLETEFGADISGLDKSRMATITDEQLSPQLTKAMSDALL